MWACKCLRIKHFHEVSSGNQPPYLLKSRYGKVSPLRCPYCQREMGLWRIWPPTYGVIYDELEAMRRGKYASQETRAAPDGGDRRALRAASGGVPVSLFGLR